MQQGYQNRYGPRRQRDGGYLLLSILLMMAMLIIAATVAAPRVVQQIKRDREEEMIHRGTEYARAIQKFYKKNGRYPASLDDLDKGQIRYLRKRFKDPLTKDGKWKLLNYGDIQMLLNNAAPGTPAAALGQQGSSLTPGGAISAASSAAGGGFQLNLGPQVQQQLQQQQKQQSQQPGLVTGAPANSDQGNNSEGTSSPSGFSSSTPSNNNQGAFSSNQPASGANQPGGTSGNQPGSPFGQNPAGTVQGFGGGAIVGVASMSKDPTIRIYNKKKKYDEWQFIYNPMMEQANVLLRGPYQPITIGGGQVGIPAGQMNGQQQSPFGQQQPSSGFGQQPNTPQMYQPQQPGGSLPQQNQQ